MGVALSTCTTVTDRIERWDCCHRIIEQRYLPGLKHSNQVWSGATTASAASYTSIIAPPERVFAPFTQGPPAIAVCRVCLPSKARFPH
jgi:hypothetical protein